jgi:hypothetical protein
LRHPGSRRKPRPAAGLRAERGAVPENDPRRPKRRYNGEEEADVPEPSPILPNKRGVISWPGAAILEACRAYKISESMSTGGGGSTAEWPRSSSVGEGNSG